MFDHWLVHHLACDIPLDFCFGYNIWKVQFLKLQVLTNGIEVKLQRNALSVIEAPTGNEGDDDLEFDNLHWNVSDMGEFVFFIQFHP